MRVSHSQCILKCDKNKVEQVWFDANSTRIKSELKRAKNGASLLILGVGLVSGTRKCPAGVLAEFQDPRTESYNFGVEEFSDARCHAPGSKLRPGLANRSVAYTKSPI